MGAFRWLRDHYNVIRFASGATLVVLGLLLFFHRDWWLRVLLNRLLDGSGSARSSPDRCYIPRVATILLAGVDLFFRGKLEVLLPEHRLVTTDTVDEPELVIADVSRIEPEEVADAYPDIPIVGFTNHTDTAGLRRAHAAGFDQVLAKSALDERAPDLIGELLSPVE